jgi:hypothetical protein
MNLDAFTGKRFSLWMTDENDDSVVYGGWTATRSGETLLLERPGGHLVLESGWLDRITPVNDDETRRILLDADFFVRLSVGPNPSEDDTDLPTGMRWPE